MEIVIQVILLLSIIKYCVKAALTGNYKGILLLSLFSSLVAIVIYPILIKQSVNVIDIFLANKAMVADGALLITIESVGGIMLAIKFLDFNFLHKKRASKWMIIQKLFPGILFVFAIAYFEILFMSYRIGVNFLYSSLLFSFFIMLGVFLISMIIMFLVKEENQKIELSLIINLFILFFGLLVHSMISDYSISSAKTKIDWGAMATLFFIVIVFVVIGRYAPVFLKQFKNYKKL